MSDKTESPESLLSDPGYFLSASNPLATTDQRDIEDTAIRLSAMPEVQAAKKAAGQRWLAGMGRTLSQEARGMFDEFIDTWTFLYALKAANSDACYPRIVTCHLPPHHWFGRDVPGSHTGGPTADNAYRLIPVEHGAAYEIHGQRKADSPSDFSFTLTRDFGNVLNVAMLDAAAIKCDGHGYFRITIDADAANGRPNHLQTIPGTSFVFIRDTLGDWQVQTPNRLHVRRLSAPSRETLTHTEMAARAARNLLEEVPFFFWLGRSLTGQMPNAIGPVISSGANFGGLPSQASAFGFCALSDDDALVITLQPAGAAYCSIAVYDWWLRSIDDARRTSSMNNAQMQLSADGSATFVISVFDPGIANWIDIGGFHEGLVFLRWQQIPLEGKHSEPAATSRLLQRKDLSAALSDVARPISAEARKHQLAARHEQYMRRFVQN